MAERRMFSKTVTKSDAFLDMPTSARCLYFHLGMQADDDGFIFSPKAIIRSLNCSEDDLKLLIENNVYRACIQSVSNMGTKCIQNVSEMDTQERLSSRYDELESLQGELPHACCIIQNDMQRLDDISECYRMAIYNLEMTAQLEREVV